MARVTGVQNPTPDTTPRPRPLTLAAVLTLGTGIAFVVVAIAVMIARQAIFSAGVAVMLALYGVLVTCVGALLWRRAPMAFGAGVTCSLIHTLVLINLARGDHGLLFGLLAVVPVVALVCLFTPAARRDFGRG